MNLRLTPYRNSFVNVTGDHSCAVRFFRHINHYIGVESRFTHPKSWYSFHSRRWLEICPLDNLNFHHAGKNCAKISFFVEKRAILPRSALIVPIF